MKCPRCKIENSNVSKFCGACGQPMFGMSDSTQIALPRLSPVEELARELFINRQRSSSVSDNRQAIDAFDCAKAFYAELEKRRAGK
jgi:hypothetical protein